MGSTPTRPTNIRDRGGTWKTRDAQNVVGSGPWRFESSRSHQLRWRSGSAPGLHPGLAGVRSPHGAPYNWFMNWKERLVDSILAILAVVFAAAVIYLLLRNFS